MSCVANQAPQHFSVTICSMYTKTSTCGSFTALKKADGTAMLTLKLTLRDVITHVPCTVKVEKLQTSVADKLRKISALT